MKPIVITIDGPAGAGKTTVSKKLAAALGYKYIDTGALYRAVALAAQRAGVLATDDDGLDDICRRLRLDFKTTGDAFRIILNDEDISDFIRTPEISMLASAVSARPVVREHLLSIQKGFARTKKAVFEGRDMGTVVFPDAEIKFFLTASTETRAERRYKELAETTSVSLKEVEEDLIKRDKNDSSRAIAPLKPAEDAVLVDSTSIAIEEVVRKMLEHIQAIID